MLDIADKENGNFVDADEFDSIVFELENAVKDTGQTLSGADLTQLSKSISNYVATGSFYSVAYDADTYTFSVIGSRKAPTSYTDGMVVRGIVVDANGGPAIANVGGLGDKPIRKNEAADVLIANDIIAGILELVFIAAQDAFDIKSIYAATTDRAGKIKLATIAETATGLVTDKAVTPETLKPLIDDAKAKVSVDDTTPSYLDTKLLAGDGMQKSVQNDGGNETLTISANFSLNNKIYPTPIVATAAQTVVTFVGVVIPASTATMKGHIVIRNGVVATEGAGEDYQITDGPNGQITWEYGLVAGDVIEYYSIQGYAPVAA